MAPALLAAQGGFMPVIGGLPPGSGISGGVEYRHRRLARGAAEFSARAIGSPKKYEHLDLRLVFPPLEDRRLFAEVGLRYRNYPQEDFWGLGPTTSPDRRTSLRLEDLNYTAAAGVKPWRWLRIGAEAGFLNVNTGPGRDDDYPSIEQRFVALEAPALDRQPHFQHTGAFAEVNYRSRPDTGIVRGSYAIRLTSYHDRTLGRYHFRRWNIDLRQFLPSFQPTATVAARFTASLTEKAPGRQVPFFLQPTVGGGNDLRGYHQYRFRDENSLAMSLEYRWRLHRFIETVAFADAGRVFSRPGQFGLKGMRGSIGVGGRLRLGDRLMLGLDLGWSPEGLRPWFRGSEAF